MDLPVNVLIVGGGSIGERHLRCFQQTPPSQVALCELNDKLRGELKERYGLRRCYETVDLAASDQWDAAVICTPAHLHIEHVVTLGPSCAAFMIEKPLSTRLDQIPQLFSATEGKVVNVAYVSRINPAVQAVRQLIQENTLGQVLQVTSISGQHFPTFRPAYREIYYTDHNKGGGAVQDAATHTFDLVHYLAGPFDWIFCDFQHQSLPGMEVEDTVHVVGQTRLGATMVSIALNQFMAPNETVVQLNGTLGSAQLRLHENRYGIFRHGNNTWEWNDVGVTERDDLFRMQARLFLDACAGQSDIMCSLHDALHALHVSLAALKSNGREKIDIPFRPPTD